MKKTSALITISLAVIFIFSGCGQDVNLTVYNATGITSASGWLAISVKSEYNSDWFFPTSYAANETYCSPSNSYTVKLKENTSVTVGGNGIVYDGEGGESEITLPIGNVLLYGGLTGAPAWYAAVNLESVVFYKK